MVSLFIFQYDIVSNFGSIKKYVNIVYYYVIFEQSYALSVQYRNAMGLQEW